MIAAQPEEVFFSILYFTPIQISYLQIYTIEFYTTQIYTILRRYKFLIYKFTNSTMNLIHTQIKIDGTQSELNFEPIQQFRSR